jgi:hypothetical protein
MGLQQNVTFAEPAPPFWPALATWLVERGYPVQVRMIDGELAFPDEAPPDAWRELRLGTPGGMVTLRRQSGRIDLVIWGNADAANRQAANALALALATLTGGRVVTDTESFAPDEYRQTADLPPWREHR